MRVVSPKTRERAIGLLAAITVHLLLGGALLIGLARRGEVAVPDAVLIAFDLPVPKPPEPPPAATPDRAGAAAPPSLKAKPRPAEAPTALVPLSARSAAPVASDGDQPKSGASVQDGVGTGDGGHGFGTGSGLGGDGSGGGMAVRAHKIAGDIRSRDFPLAARRAGGTASVTAFYTVNRDGSVSGCRIVRSSGIVELDAATCRLIETRFRYAPARNGKGDAIADRTGWKQDWWLGDRKP